MNDDAPQGELEIQVDGEGLTARLVIPADVDESSLDADAAIECARDRGVLVDDEVAQRIRAAVEAFRAAPSRLEVVIAEATAPVDGTPGWVQWEDGFDPTDEHPHNIVAPDGDTSARADFYNVSHYIEVDDGTKVAMLHSATRGVDGVDVTGRTISATPGRKCDIAIDPSLTVDSAGGVVAALNGLLVLKNNVLKVTRLLEVDEYVDFSTGNIAFDGSVVVKEGVRDCFVIKATEDVTVHGLIEAATIMCGGNFECRRGMAARDRGQLIVDGNAQAGFLNNVRGRVSGDLTVRNEMMACKMAVGGSLNVERGTIVGGTTAIAGSAGVGTIGSDIGTPTTLIMGIDPLLTARLGRLDAYRRQVAAELARLEGIAHSCDEGRNMSDPASQKVQGEASSEIAHHRQLLVACSEKTRQLQMRLAASRQLDLKVAKFIHPKVRLNLHDSEVIFDTTLKGPVHIYWDEQRHILFRQGDGPVREIADVAKVYRAAA